MILNIFKFRDKFEFFKQLREGVDSNGLKVDLDNEGIYFMYDRDDKLVYIGQSSDLSGRFFSHSKLAKTKKYGEDDIDAMVKKVMIFSFEWDTDKLCIINKDTLESTLITLERPCLNYDGLDALIYPEMYLVAKTMLNILRTEKCGLHLYKFFNNVQRFRLKKDNIESYGYVPDCEYIEDIPGQVLADKYIIEHWTMHKIAEYFKIEYSTLEYCFRKWKLVY